MADRGRLFYDSDGKLRQVDPTASISGAPDEADLEPVEFVAVTAESLVNDVYQPSLDMVLPTWLAKTKAIIPDILVPDNNYYRQANTGSATFDPENTRGLLFDTGSTDGSRAEAIRIYNVGDDESVHPRMTWDADQAFYALVEFVRPTNRSDFIGPGALWANHGFGFILENQDIKGRVRDDTAANDTSILKENISDPERVELLAILDDSAGEVKFYVNNFDIGSPDATLSSNLPFGTDTARRLMGVRVTNSEAANKSLRIFDARRVIMP